MLGGASGQTFPYFGTGLNPTASIHQGLWRRPPFKTWENFTEPTSVLDLRSPSPSSRAGSARQGASPVTTEAAYSLHAGGSSSSSYDEDNETAVPKNSSRLLNQLREGKLATAEARKCHDHNVWKAEAMWAAALEAIGPVSKLQRRGEQVCEWKVGGSSSANKKTSFDTRLSKHPHRNGMENVFDLQQNQERPEAQVSPVGLYSDRGNTLPVLLSTETTFSSSTEESQLGGESYGELGAPFQTTSAETTPAIKTIQDIPKRKWSGHGAIGGEPGDCSLDEWLADLQAASRQQQEQQPHHQNVQQQEQQVHYSREELESLFFKAPSPTPCPPDQSLIKWLLGETDQSQFAALSRTDITGEEPLSWNTATNQVQKNTGNVPSSLPQHPVHTQHHLASSCLQTPSSSPFLSGMFSNSPSMLNRSVPFCTQAPISEQETLSPSQPDGKAAVYLEPSSLGQYYTSTSIPSTCTISPLPNPLYHKPESSTTNQTTFGQQRLEQTQFSYSFPLQTQDASMEPFCSKEKPIAYGFADQNYQRTEPVGLDFTQVLPQRLDAETTRHQHHYTSNLDQLPPIHPTTLHGHLHASGPTRNFNAWSVQQQQQQKQQVDHYRGKETAGKEHQEEPLSFANFASPWMAKVGPFQEYRLSNPVVTGSSDDGLAVVNQLLQLAEAIDIGDMEVIRSILARLNQHIFFQGKCIQRLSYYFKEALTARIMGNPPHPILGEGRALSPSELFHRVRAYKNFCEISPFCKFGYFTANQAILEAVEGNDSIHIIDFETQFGGQWASFLQDISMRPGAPPRVRMTVVGSQQEELKFAGEGLCEFARALNIPLHFEVVANNPGCLTPVILQLREGEPVIVNFMFSLHRALGDSSSNVDSILSFIRGISPKLVTLVEQELDDNGPSFHRRFSEALQYYAFLFDSLGPGDTSSEMVRSIEKLILAPDIMNIVACEGSARKERHEKFQQWQRHFHAAGFSTVPFSELTRIQGEYLVRKASNGRNYGIVQDGGSLLLGWQGKALVAASAWSC